MSEALVIDNVEFARHNECLTGALDIAAMPRLRDALADTAGQVIYRLAGRTGRQGKLVLECDVSGTLSLVCQRCLQSLRWPVGLHSDLEIDSSGAEDADSALDDGPDRIDADARMDVHALIEDELLLALPLSPRHDAGQCRMQAAAALPGDAGALAGLGDLMRQRTDNDTKE